MGMPIITQGALLAAIAAGGAALWFYADAQGKATQIETLTTQLNTANGNTAAALVLAQDRPPIVVRYRDGLAAVQAAGERTSDACLTDPRVRAAYAAIGLRDNPAGDAAGSAER